MLTMAIPWLTPLSVHTPNNFPNSIITLFPSPMNYIQKPVSFHGHRRTLILSSNLNKPTHYPSEPSPGTSSRFPLIFLQCAASAVLVFGLGIRSCLAASPPFPGLLPANSQTVEEQITRDSVDSGESDEDFKASFESWKSKTYALTVPLRIVSLRGSVPPSWVKEFLQSQGKRVKLRSEFRASLNDIYFDISKQFSRAQVDPKSALAADLITVGDSWLSFAVKNSIIDPIQGVDDQDWFTHLGDKWKVFLRRNDEGEIDSEGKIWAAPYRWGSMVIAYKKNKFQQHKLAPIEDWAALWRPELAGRISMVDSPREVIGAVLKYMGASYNADNLDLNITGGRDAVRKNLETLQKQVRLFDSQQYLKAFGVGDVWVAVGWSSDVLPAAKRMSNVAVIVPKSGTSLWADMWAIPAATKLKTDKIGGRVRGPSPLIHQWIEFCLQAARALPFKQEIVPGASPFALENASKITETPPHQTGNKPKLETNLIAGVPPTDILDRCEFLEPLSESSLSDHKWLISSIQKSKPGFNLINSIQLSFGFLFKKLY